MDSLISVRTVQATPYPQAVCYSAMHQDYSAKPISLPALLAEQKAGQTVVERCLKKGHWGVIEHVHIALSCSYFPHSVMQQARTHRHLSFDVQSGRYTSENLLAGDVEKAIYFRPTGKYTDRTGKLYEYGPDWRSAHKRQAASALESYKCDLAKGMSEEHARGMVPFDLRQHWVMSGNLRSMLHFVGIRNKKDAQLECQWLAQLVTKELGKWCPEILCWYSEKYKGRLAP